MDMRIVKEINFLDDDRMLVKLAWLQIILFLPLLGLLVFLLSLDPAFNVTFGANGGSFEITGEAIGAVLGGIALTGAIIVVHELIHGLAFKFFGDENTKVKYGFTKGMFYASCPDAQYVPRHFVVILAAPTVINTVILVAICALGWPAIGGIALFMHTLGCVGDWYMLWQMFRARGTYDLCVDTPTGIMLGKRS